jgi:hypothetical protein
MEGSLIESMYLAYIHLLNIISTLPVIGQGPDSPTLLAIVSFIEVLTAAQ